MKKRTRTFIGKVGPTTYKIEDGPKEIAVYAGVLQPPNKKTGATETIWKKHFATKHMEQVLRYILSGTNGTVHTIQLSEDFREVE